MWLGFCTAVVALRTAAVLMRAGGVGLGRAIVLEEMLVILRNFLLLVKQQVQELQDVWRQRPEFTDDDKQSLLTPSVCDVIKTQSVVHGAANVPEAVNSVCWLAVHGDVAVRGGGFTAACMFLFQSFQNSSPLSEKDDRQKEV